MVQTYRDRVADYLKGNAGQWVDGLVLQEIGGRYAWRSRVSDCRTQLGMVVENRLRKVGDRTVSEYRFVPAAGQQALPLGQQGAAA